MGASLLAQPRSIYCWIGKCDILLYQLICLGKTTGPSSEPARWSCDNCQRMSDFDSFQCNYTHTDGFHNLTSVKWQRLTWSVCTGVCTQEPITWSLHLPYKPSESTLSDEKLFIEIAFAEYFSRLLSNIQSEQSYDHTSHAESQKRDLNCCQQWR